MCTILIFTTTFLATYLNVLYTNGDFTISSPALSRFIEYYVIRTFTKNISHICISTFQITRLGMVFMYSHIKNSLWNPYFWNGICVIEFLKICETNSTILFAFRQKKHRLCSVFARIRSYTSISVGLFNVDHW